MSNLTHLFSVGQKVRCNMDGVFYKGKRGRMKKKWWYLKIKFKDFHNGRKIWYMNDYYLCDCVNLPFESKEECEKCILEVKTRYGDLIECITLHWTR